MTGVVRTVLTVERNWLTKKPDGDQTPSSIRFCPASFFHPFLRSLVPSAFRCALHHDHGALSLSPSASSRLPNRNLPLHPASTKKAPASLVHLPPTLRLLQHPCDVRGLVPQRRCRLLGQSPGGEAGEAHWPVVRSLFGGRSQFQRVQLQVLDIVFAGTQPLGCANDSPSFLSAFVLSFLRAQRLGASTSDRTIDRSMQGWLHGGIVETTMQQCMLRPWSHSGLTNRLSGKSTLQYIEVTLYRSTTDAPSTTSRHVQLKPSFSRKAPPPRHSVSPHQLPRSTGALWTLVLSPTSRRGGELVFSDGAAIWRDTITFC